MRRHKLNIRLRTNGEELYPEDFVLRTTDKVSPELVVSVVEQFKEQNEDYCTMDVIVHILKYTGGLVDTVGFKPDVDLAI